MAIKTPKDKILISFSGGETSAYMLQHILSNYAVDHEIVVLFANTGEENEATLEFIHKCSDHFNVEVVWLEYKRLSYTVVDYHTAYRSHDPEEIKNLWPNSPFRHYISDFMIPNLQNFSCTRELKEYTMNRYLKSIKWKPSKHTKAIGIRADEIDRVKQHWYPLAILGITKPMVNSFWASMPFRLGLKGYEGNCKACWKKSIRKLITIARHNPEWFAFVRQMELEFSGFVKESRKTTMTSPVRFFREFRTVDDIFEMAKDKSILDAEDDSVNTSVQGSIWGNNIDLDASSGCSESCEVFTD